MYDKVKCEVNKQLAFEGFSINEANQLLSVEKASKISDVQVRVDGLKSRLKAQGAHTLVFSYCNAELLANNYNMCTASYVNTLTTGYITESVVPYMKKYDQLSAEVSEIDSRLTALRERFCK